MALFTNVGGTWRTVSAVWTNVGGTWRKCNVFTHAAGVWKAVATAKAAQLNAASPGSTVSGSAATATMRLNSNGNFDCSTISNVITTQFAWKVSADATSAFEVFVSLDSGALTSGIVGSWLNLGTTRDYTVQKGTVGNASASVTVTIRDPVSGVYLAQRAYTISATRSS